MGGPIRAGCLGEEAEKTGKGRGRERIWHSASDIAAYISPLTWPACLILEPFFVLFFSEWGLPNTVAKALGEEGFCCSIAALLGLTEEDIRIFELKKGEMAALRTAVGQLQAEGRGGPLIHKTATPAPSRRPSMLLHDLLTTNADEVDIGARASRQGRSGPPVLPP